MLTLTNLSAHDVCEMAKYFNYFQALRESQGLLETYQGKYPDDAEIAYLYVSTGSLYNLLAHFHEDYYMDEIDRLARLNRPRLCDYFNRCYQLTRLESVREKCVRIAR